MNLTGNTILITGGATGIGFALARQLSERGSRVVICGRSEAALQKAHAEFPQLMTRVCDITSADARHELVEWLRTTYPGLNVLINNAGVQYIFASSRTARRSTSSIRKSPSTSPRRPSDR